jgi:hypothetical protein
MQKIGRAGGYGALQKHIFLLNIGIANKLMTYFFIPDTHEK